ncbi:MAG: hypothetical protein WDM87_00030 [Terracidiphilus sp.]
MSSPDLHPKVEPKIDLHPDVRTVASTQSEKTEIVLPNDTNMLGNLLGGAADALYRSDGGDGGVQALALQRGDRGDGSHRLIIRPVRLGDLVTLKSSVKPRLYEFDGSGREGVGGKYANRGGVSCCQRVPGVCCG